MKNDCLLLLIGLLLKANFAFANYSVNEVFDDGKIQLSDGKVIELAGLYIPPEIKNKTVEYIKKYINDKKVDVVVSESKLTSYNSYLADDIKVNGGSLVLSLIKAGLAANYNMEKPYIIDNEKKLAENESIKTKSGLWSDSYYILLNKNELEKNSKTHLYKFRVVIGQVMAVKLVKDKLYINFGDDWKTDFTVIISKENLKNFGNVEPEKLAGKKVMVKGWIEFCNGAAMEIYNASHLDSIDKL
jgi:hypothetical protein